MHLECRPNGGSELSPEIVNRHDAVMFGVLDYAGDCGYTSVTPKLPGEL